MAGQIPFPPSRNDRAAIGLGDARIVLQCMQEEFAWGRALEFAAVAIAKNVLT